MILTIGAYHNKVPGSIGVGLDQGPATDVIMDMRRLAYADGSIEAIYTFDAVEHVPMADQPTVFREMFRVLVPGGTVEVCTVDLEGLCREFLVSDHAKRKVLLAHFYGSQSFPGDFHAAGFDEAILSELLEQAGFVDLSRAAPSHPWGGSLAMTARRPP